jgi:hypothetical protein
MSWRWKVEQDELTIGLGEASSVGEALSEAFRQAEQYAQDWPITRHFTMSIWLEEPFDTGGAPSQSCAESRQDRP